MASRLNGHEFEQTPGNHEGHGSLACCNAWGLKELGMTDGLNNEYISTRINISSIILIKVKMLLRIPA